MIKKVSALFLAGCMAMGVVAETTPASRVINQTEGSDLTQGALFYYNSPDESGWKKAFEFATRAIEINSNDLVAHRLLGNMYYHGKGTTVNREEALYHYLQASDGDAVSAYMAGRMYLNGDGINIDVEDGAALVKEAADMGEPLAQYELAQLSLDQSRVEQNAQMKLTLEKSAYYYASLCAKQKNSSCMKILGQIFENGLAGVPVSKDSANSLYEMASKFE